MSGDGVMLGYLNNEEANAKTFTKDRWTGNRARSIISVFLSSNLCLSRWMRTGDIGHITEDGTVYISDRLKELIKVNIVSVNFFLVLVLSV